MCAKSVSRASWQTCSNVFGCFGADLEIYCLTFFMTSTAKQKVLLREQVLKVRRAMTSVEREEQSVLIMRQFLALPEYLAAQSVGLYASKLDEVATDGLIEQALVAGKRVALPRVKGDELEWCVVGSLLDLHEGYFGVREPCMDSLVVAASELELLVVPGVAFDAAGRRLGYGKGFYDATLKDYTGRTVGLAFDCQMVAAVPTNNFDQRVGRVLVN